MLSVIKRSILGAVLLACSTMPAWAANDFYTHGSFPATGSSATSATMRAELDLISAGFDKLPALTSNGSKAVVVNSGGTALTVTTGTLTLSGNLNLAAAFTTSGAYSITLTATAATSITLPTTGTLATLAGTETLTNKTLTAPIISTISNTGTLTLTTSTDTLVGRDTTDTLTNKTLTSPTIAKLANLTSNGFVKTSGGDGTLSVDTSTYITNVNSGTSTNISGLLLGNGSTIAAYGGSSCSNQFPRSLSAAGAATCATVSLTADVTGALPAANGGTGLDTSSSSGLPHLSSGTWSVSTTQTPRIARLGIGGATVGSANTAAFYGSTSGYSLLQAQATAGTTTFTLPTTTGTLIGSGDSGTVTQTMHASSSVGTAQLKTSTGSVSGAGGLGVIANDYSFGPSITNDTSGLQTVNTYGPLADPGNTVMRFSINAAVGTTTVRWRYVNSTDNPTIWLGWKGPANSKPDCVWVSDDPLPGNLSGCAYPSGTTVQVALDDLDVRTAHSAAVRAARDWIAAKGYRNDAARMKYRTLQQWAKDEAPSVWILKHCTYTEPILACSAP